MVPKILVFLFTRWYYYLIELKPCPAAGNKMFLGKEGFVMKTKTVLFFLITGIVIVSAASALDVRMGGGFGYEFYDEGLKVDIPNTSRKADISNLWHDIGFKGFVEFPYVQIDFAYYGTAAGTYRRMNFGSGNTKEAYSDLNLSYLEFGLSGKYNVFRTFSALLGMSYKINLINEYKLNEPTMSKRTEWNQFWIHGGFDLNIYITERLFTRLQIDLGVPLMWAYWDEEKPKIRQYLSVPDTDLTYSGFGCTFFIGLGYQLGNFRHFESF
jgi:hypothetical protein